MIRVLLVVVSIIITIAVSVWLSSSDTTYPIIFAAPATGVMTFFGILVILSEKNDKPISDSEIRSSIAGALVVMYMVVVGFGVFTSEGYGGMSKMADTLMNHFTSIVGIAIAFYFGSSAYVQAANNKKNKEDDNRP